MENSEVDKLNEIIKSCSTIREFGKIIGEDPCDISHWKNGHRAISPRAVISICRAFPGIQPSDLLSSLFPPDLQFVFDNKGESK